MSYVTQGKVQVELKPKTGQTKSDETKTEIAIRINPTQDYMVKRGKEDWIVFIDDNPNAQLLETKQLEARVFKKTEVFTADSCFNQALIDAALQQTVLEIKIKEASLCSPLSPISQPSFVIDSITIPATF